MSHWLKAQDRAWCHNDQKSQPVFLKPLFTVLLVTVTLTPLYCTTYTYCKPCCLYTGDKTFARQLKPHIELQSMCLCSNILQHTDEWNVRLPDTQVINLWHQQHTVPFNLRRFHYLTQMWLVEYVDWRPNTQIKTQYYWRYCYILRKTPSLITYQNRKPISLSTPLVLCNFHYST